MFYKLNTRCPQCDHDHSDDREILSSKDSFETIQCPSCDYVFMVITQFIHESTGQIKALVFSGAFRAHYHEKVKVLS